jgi:hypothetical protein
MYSLTAKLGDVDTNPMAAAKFRRAARAIACNKRILANQFRERSTSARSLIPPGLAPASPS